MGITYERDFAHCLLKKWVIKSTLARTSSKEYASWYNTCRLFYVTIDYHPYKACMDACMRCASICNHCATMCLKEKDVHMMIRCIQLDRECATICFMAAQMMSMQSNKVKEICSICGNECDKHDNDHCKECAAACFYCAQECGKISF